MPKSAIFTIAFFCIFFILFGVGMLSVLLPHDSDETVFIMIAILMIVAGFTPAFLYLRKMSIQHKVIKYGTLIQAEFLDVIEASYSINDFSPNLIRAQWLDESTNIVYRFQSRPLEFDPSDALDFAMKIPVRIDPKNPKHYYMEIEKIPALRYFL